MTNVAERSKKLFNVVSFNLTKIMLKQIYPYIPVVDATRKAETRSIILNSLQLKYQFNIILYVYAYTSVHTHINIFEGYVWQEI